MSENADGHTILRLAWYINNVSEENVEKKLMNLDPDTAAALCMPAYVIELQNAGMDLPSELSGSNNPIGFNTDGDLNDDEPDI